MIGNNVGDQPHLPSMQGFRQAHERFLVADFRIEFRVIRYVVAVQASRPRHEKRRRVNIADSQFVQVFHQTGRLIERERFVEL